MLDNTARHASWGNALELQRLVENQYPVLAIAGQQSRNALGGHDQQEVDLPSLFKDVAGAFVQQASTPVQVRHLVDRAIRISLAERRVTAIILPNDLQEAEYVEPPRAHGTLHSGIGFSRPKTVPYEADLRRAAEVSGRGRSYAYGRRSEVDKCGTGRRHREDSQQYLNSEGKHSWYESSLGYLCLFRSDGKPGRIERAVDRERAEPGHHSRRDGPNPVGCRSALDRRGSSGGPRENTSQSDGSGQWCQRHRSVPRLLRIHRIDSRTEYLRRPGFGLDSIHSD